MERSMATSPGDQAAQEDFDAASVLASLASHSPTSPINGVARTSWPQTALKQEADAAQLSNGVLSHPPQRQTSELPSNTFADVVAAPEPAQDDATVKMDVDDVTAAAIQAASNEHGMRVRKPASRPSDFVATPDMDSPEMSDKIASKKRTAPAESKKPPYKKRKSEAPSDRGTPASNRIASPTPSSASLKTTKLVTTKKSKAAKPKQPAPAKTAAPPEPSPDPEESEVSDPDTLYCICRKPDNGKFMIGCDGGCEDWFHGKCVQVSKQDELLVDRFICPNCSEAGKGVTTWKPLCRKDGCRNAARLKKGSESKYCSRDCGLAFMRANLSRSDSQHGNSAEQPRRRTKPAREAESHLGSVVGALHLPELKAIMDATPTVDSFRQLGEQPFLTPPPSATPEVHPSPTEFEYTEAETGRLEAIEARKALLRQQRLLYKDRETFQTLMKARIAPMKEVLEMKGDNAPCGFDPIWALDDISFREWRESEEGTAAFETGELKIPHNLREEDCTICIRTNHAKKRCTQHGHWQQLLLRDVRFESAEIGREMRKIDAEEKQIQARALSRSRNKASTAEQQEEGWVEVVSRSPYPKIEQPGEDAGATPLALAAEVKLEADVRPAYARKTSTTPAADGDTVMTEGG